MNRFFTFIAFLLLINLQSFTQQIDFESHKDYFDSPLDIPLYLSANFGELRETHFHAGLDFKTQGSKGKNIYAAAEGYISRIKIQENGYGKVLYVNHPAGFTTVYAHCDYFSEKIEKYIKEYQYRNETYTVDVYLKSDEIPVERREIIAISGNSGGSGGPHLHFEIRESASQEALNGLKFNFDVRDDVSPKFTRLCVYPMSEQSAVNGSNTKFCTNVILQDSIYILENNINAYGLLSFGVEGFDYLNYSRNRCALYGLHLYADEDLIYSYNINEIDFNETSCVRSHLDYEERIKHKDRIQKSYIEPNNILRFYNPVTGNGVVSVTENEKKFRYIAEDAYGNISELYFTVVASEKYKPDTSAHKSDFVKVFSYDSDNAYKTTYCEVFVPKNALYSDIEFQFSQVPLNGGLSDLFYIQNEYTALDKRFTIGIKAPNNMSDALREKLVVVNVEGEESKSIGGELSGDFVYAKTKEFGKFRLDIDTVAPTFQPINIVKGSNMQAKHSIRMVVKDDLSGIKSYNGYIDNNWALFEYDPKNDLLEYFFDTLRISTNMEHELELYVSDEKNNLATYYTTFFY